MPVWRSVRHFKAKYPDAEIQLGGIYASILPKHAKLSGADLVHVGVIPETENLVPDYDLVPEWDGSIIHASRGCNNSCLYCAVPYIEGKLSSERNSIKKFVWPGHSKIIFFDNNIFASCYWKDIFREVIELDKEVDFNQGLEARLITDEAAQLLSQMKIPLVRLAYDTPDQKNHVKKAIVKLQKYGISKRNISVYALFNYTETPDEFFERVRDILNWGAVCYPMQFQPCETLKKNSYISIKWTKKQVNMVASARRVIGYGGAFPPYQALIDKWNKCNDFEEAFTLEPRK